MALTNICYDPNYVISTKFVISSEARNPDKAFHVEVLLKIPSFARNDNAVRHYSFTLLFIQ